MADIEPAETAVVASGKRENFEESDALKKGAAEGVTAEEDVTAEKDVLVGEDVATKEGGEKVVKFKGYSAKSPTSADGSSSQRYSPELNGGENIPLLDPTLVRHDTSKSKIPQVQEFVAAALMLSASVLAGMESLKKSGKLVGAEYQASAYALCAVLYTASHVLEKIDLISSEHAQQFRRNLASVMLTASAAFAAFYSAKEDRSFDQLFKSWDIIRASLMVGVVGSEAISVERQKQDLGFSSLANVVRFVTAIVAGTVSFPLSSLARVLSGEHSWDGFGPQHMLHNGTNNNVTQFVCARNLGFPGQQIMYDAVFTASGIGLLMYVYNAFKQCGASEYVSFNCALLLVGLTLSGMAVESAAVDCTMLLGILIPVLTVLGETLGLFQTACKKTDDEENSGPGIFINPSHTANIDMDAEENSSRHNMDL